MEDSVLIAMTCYRRPEYTELTIKELREKTIYKNYKLICVNDGCPDGNKEILEKFKLINYIDGLIHNDENKGIPTSINKVWRSGSFDHYLKYDNDVIINQPDWLNRLIEARNTFPEFGVIGHQVESLKENGIWHEKQSINNPAIMIRMKDVACNINGACLEVSKELLGCLGYFYEFPNPYGHEDAEYSARCRYHLKRINAYTEWNNGTILEHRDRNKEKNQEYENWKFGSGIMNIPPLNMRVGIFKRKDFNPHV